MAVFTLCFCGTSCWPDEGIEDRSISKYKGTNQEGSDPEIYGKYGYIPVGVYADIEASRSQGKAVIPGPGEAWAYYWKSLWVPSTIKTWGGSNRDIGSGESMWDLAGHAAAKVVGVPSMGRGEATVEGIEHYDQLDQLYQKVKNLTGADLKPDSKQKPPSHERYLWGSDLLLQLVGAIQSKRDGGENAISTINLIGHSRGGVAAIMCAHELEYLFPNAQLNIFAIDPVPGSGNLSLEMCTLSSNVKNYVGVYALDETSAAFNGVVPRPYYKGELIDPLAETKEEKRIDIPNYHLIYAPGRHATVAGNKTSDGKPNKGKNNENVAKVGQLVGWLARALLKRWGTEIEAPNWSNSKVRENFGKLQKAMTEHAELFREMRQYTYYGDVHTAQHWTERGITSSESGSSAWSYLEDAIGLVESEERRQEERSYFNLGSYFTKLQKTRPQPGKVKWQSIESIPISVIVHGKWSDDK